jgi:hypothetical protein
MAESPKSTADPSAQNTGLVMTTLVSRAVINGSSELVNSSELVKVTGISGGGAVPPDDRGALQVP